VNESRLEDQEKEAARHKEFYDKNLSEYKDLCKKLSDTLEELTGKTVRMESEINQTTKIKSHLELENDHLKEELSEKITQLGSHKESNFKLTQGMEEAINKIESKNKQIDNLNLKIDSDSRMMSEQVTKHEGTIAQQTKLIDFLQVKVEELEGRKKTFADKLFGGNKENKENHLIVGYQDIQHQLQSERAKNRKLADQLTRVRSEVVALKTNTSSSKSETHLPRSVLNQIDPTKTAKHNIPHRLHSGTIKKTSRCPVCQETLGFMNLAQICKDCGVGVHSGCSSGLPPTCGLSSSLVSALQASSPARPRAKSVSRGRSNSQTSGM
jgi:citron Rho-interacting kinase